MDYKNIDIDNLKNIVEKSNSFVEVTNKLGFNSKNLTIKRNIDRFLIGMRRHIFMLNYHFTTKCLIVIVGM